MGGRPASRRCRVPGGRDRSARRLRLLALCPRPGVAGVRGLAERAAGAAGANDRVHRREPRGLQGAGQAPAWARRLRGDYRPYLLGTTWPSLGVERGPLPGPWRGLLDRPGLPEVGRTLFWLV